MKINLFRSALSLMKICGGDIDPDSGKGLEKFRTSQKYVKFAKQKFDKQSLACLQKVIGNPQHFQKKTCFISLFQRYFLRHNLTKTWN